MENGRRAQIHRLAAGALAALLTLGTAGVRVPAAVTSEWIVADRLAGVALYGFDPVAYFVEGAARPGHEAFELVFAGLTWRFRGEANRAAFRAAPDAFVPVFGGYDPIALARRAPVPGHPELFVIHEDRLYLFHQPATREAFLVDPAAKIGAARVTWPEVRRTLVP